MNNGRLRLAAAVPSGGWPESCRRVDNTPRFPTVGVRKQLRSRASGGMMEPLDSGPIDCLRGGGQSAPEALRGQPLRPLRLPVRLLAPGSTSPCSRVCHRRGRAVGRQGARGACRSTPRRSTGHRPSRNERARRHAEPLLGRLLVTERPELLFVSPRFLFPADTGGAIRTSEILRGLKGGAFRICLLSAATGDEERRYASQLAEISDQWECWPTAAKRSTLSLHRIPLLASRLPV